MTGNRAVEILKAKLTSAGGQARIELLREHKGRVNFLAEMRADGVDVDNLDEQPFLPWKAFEATVDLLCANDGRARKGNAQGGGRLGSKDVPVNSVEGRVASAVYGVPIGGTLTRRSTAISNILVWAGVCRHGIGELHLIPEREDYAGD